MCFVVQLPPENRAAPNREMLWWLNPASRQPGDNREYAARTMLLHRPAARFAHQAEGAAVHLHQGFHQGEAEAGALLGLGELCLDLLERVVAKLDMDLRGRHERLGRNSLFQAAG